jgi:hypothetical protein
MLTILSCEESLSSDSAVFELARFLGLEAEIVPLVGDLSAPPPSFQHSQGDGLVLAMGAATLRKVFRKAWFTDILGESRLSFFYGFVAAGDGNPELQWLTRGALSSVVGLGSAENLFTVDFGAEEGIFPVSGRSFKAAPVGPESTAAFLVPAGSTMQPAITVNGRPHFARVDVGRCGRFFLAERDLVGIDRALLPEQTLRPWYPQLIAAVIFLRSAFGDRCWTSPVTGATLIIDDPYLKPRYGFLRYDSLLPELRKTGGAVTVGFIPYNYRRSDPRTVAFVGGYPENFSIAVHGCDHMAAEHASIDETWLEGTTARALARMEAHALRSGLSFDNIMVFPYGKFSTKAVRALGACGVHAAVNTEAWPRDHGGSHPTIRDHLDVAMTRYEPLPLFIRRYPRDVFDFAFDALFQKPILGVEHHEFFRDGLEALGKLVREVSSLSPRVKWMPLGRTLESSYLLRRTGEGRCALRHFMPTVRIRNPDPNELQFAVEKPEWEDRVDAVLVNGREVPFEVRSRRLTYGIRLGPGEEADVRIRSRAARRPIVVPSWKYRINVRVRRMLSEIRDNQLARNRHVLALAVKTRGLLRTKQSR